MLQFCGNILNMLVEIDVVNGFKKQADLYNMSNLHNFMRLRNNQLTGMNRF